MPTANPQNKPAPTASLLNLDTVVQRPVITIDGVRHHIVSPSELSIIDTHRLSMQGKRMEELAKQSELSEDEERELSDLLRSSSNIIMAPIDANVRDKLPDIQRQQVIEVFTVLLLTTKAGTAAGMMEGLMATMPVTGPMTPPTGVTSSPVSRASMAAQRKAGSKKPRSRS